MGCDTDYPRSPSPWDVAGVAYDEWFVAFPVELRSGSGRLVCGVCGASVADRGARLHIEWHTRESKRQEI